MLKDSLGTVILSLRDRLSRQKLREDCFHDRGRGSSHSLSSQVRGQSLVLWAVGLWQLGHCSSLIRVTSARETQWDHSDIVSACCGCRLHIEVSPATCDWVCMWIGGGHFRGTQQKAVILSSCKKFCPFVLLDASVQIFKFVTVAQWQTLGKEKETSLQITDPANLLRFHLMQERRHWRRAELRD